MAGMPDISGWDWLFMAVLIGFIGWGSIELTIALFKWIICHLQWV